MNLSDIAVGLLRTLVPTLVGVLVTWCTRHYPLAAQLLPVDQLGVFAVAVVAGLWWGAVRWLEHRWPKLGWLLGYPAAPTYGSGNVDPTSAPADPSGDAPQVLPGG